MQEQNFEKQVRQKMEELSLTPSDPVWKKVEEQIRKKRDRRRLLFWLPLTVLLLSGGMWLVNNNIRDYNTIAGTNSEQEKNTRNTNSSLEKKSAAGEQQTTPFTEQEKEQPSGTIGNFHQQNQIPLQPKLKESLSPSVKSKKIQSQKRKLIIATNVSSETETTGKEPKDLQKQENSEFITGTDNTKNIKVNEIPTGDKEIKELQSYDSIANDSKIKPDLVNDIDTANEVKPKIESEEKDSLALQKKIAKNSANSNSKWEFAIAAGIGRSGVNNGVSLFGGGGAKSLETNAFADRNYYTLGSPASTPGTIYRPPSPQKKSISFSLGLQVKKQLSDRTSFSTGLQYNFYSTEMEVGENMLRDTMAAQNFSVNQFYANTGSTFSNYHNKFHFIALPLSFEVQLLKKSPLDLHIGLSLQQLLKTNALLYSSSSQIYYEDRKAFNKTYLFSELGFQYSFPLSKSLLLATGPRMSYSHSRVIKGSDRHLFSYGLATQLIFSGK